MRKFLKKRGKKTGLAPGTLVHLGKQKVENATITLIQYNADVHRQQTIDSVQDIPGFEDATLTHWLNVDGIHDETVMQAIGERFEISPLILEDMMNTDQRPKLEVTEDGLFVVLKMLFLNDQAALAYRSEQLSMLIGSNYVVSFMEQGEPLFDELRARTQHNHWRTQDLGSDFLAIAMIDTVVDHYFSVLESLGDQMTQLEESLVENPAQQTLHDIYALKREMILIRKVVWPLRDVLARLEKTGDTVIRPSTVVYLRDVYDHVVQVIDIVESFRELLSSLVDLYMSTISYRMNSIMQTLTVIATIFIPLTFIVGIYGMNFKVMPELEWVWGYPAVWLVMLAVTGYMLMYFKKKAWF